MQRALQALTLLVLLGVGGAVVLLWREAEASAEAERAARAAADERTALLTDDVAGLRADLKGLTASLNEGLGTLADRLAQQGADRARAGEDRLDALQAALEGLRAGLAQDRGTTGSEELAARLDTIASRLDALVGAVGREPVESATALESMPVAEEPAPSPAPATRKEELSSGAPELTEPDEDDTSPPPAAEPARSFLAFRLPSDDFRFDELRAWRLLDGLSRVGFDGSSTLHDFSGASTAVRGEFRANPGRPGEGIQGRIAVPVETLDTGLAARDEELRKVLDVERFPGIELGLIGFESGRVDAASESLSGTVRGTLAIRGVERDVAIPVRVELDDAHRMQIEGEAPLDLTDYGVPVPNKAGIVKMNPHVRIWFSLRARALPREES